MLLTSLAWGLATSPSFGLIVRLALSFVFVHFLLLSLMVSTGAYFLVGRLLGPGIAGLPGRRRQGLFEPVGGVEQLEFGYCFDVSVKSRCWSTMLCLVEETDCCDNAGGNTSLLPRLGIYIRCTVHPATLSIQGLLVPNRLSFASVAHQS